jgi:hypothetical protein
VGAPRDGGVLFEACDYSPYKSLDTHRSTSGTKHPKSIWNPEVSRAEECHTFCGAKLQEWHDKNGDCWAIARDGQVDFGTHEERVAFFWAPKNTTDPWHGFPVGGRRGLSFKRKPPDELVQRWYDTGVISFEKYIKLLKDRW